MPLVSPRLLVLGLAAAFPLVSGASPVITEFLAVNDSEFLDGWEQASDWIEIHNPGGEVVDLGGYLLADAEEEWAFPEGVLVEAGGYLVVFASGGRNNAEAEEQADPAGFWHASFRLGREGESLRLLDPAGQVLSEFVDIPFQRRDVSFGSASGDKVGYFTSPTPGAANGVVVLGIVGDTKFSVDRGYFSESFQVSIAVEPEDATILYTLDGRDPDKGTIFSGPTGEVYEGPIEITGTTVLKAMAYKQGWRSSNVDSQTYLFLDEVLRQPLEAPEGYPERWGGVLADYGMDPDVVDDPDYSDLFDDAFKAFPTLSISMDRDDMFGAKGIYQNTTQEGHDWERPATVEWIFPQGEERSFSVPCGMRVQGGSSRQTDIPKHSFSLRFREAYGMGTLAAPILRNSPYGQGAVARFDYLQLRSGFNFAWTHRHYYQSRHAQYNRDQFVNDLFLAMGHQGTHGRWFHLYINGLYWGMYHLHERPDANFMASYYGGEKEDYDAVNSGQPTDGNLGSWNTMWSLARDADTAEGFAALEEVLDVDAFIDYMLINFYVGNWDWDGHNWRAAGPHAGGEGAGRWMFFPWDSEFAISPNGAGAINNPAPIENSLTIDRTRVGGGANRPTGLHKILLDSPDYQIRFEDRVQRHFYNGGVFTPEHATQIWKRRSDVMDRAVVAESARWGDYKRDLVPGRWPASSYDLYTKNDYYLPNQAFILEEYLPQRPAIVLDQMRAARLLGNVEAPSLSVSGISQFGGSVPRGAKIEVDAKGSAFYTLDGETDPREDGALAYSRSEGIVLEQSALLRVRGRSIFGQWSPLAEAFFIVGQAAQPGDVVVSEIHYRPESPSESEREAGFQVRSAFEWIELTNRADHGVNLIGAHWEKGFRFNFTDDLLMEPGERVVLVNNLEAFALRYPNAVDHVVGEFEGKLSDAGERLELVNASGTVLLSVRYDDDEDDGWPEAADGDGYSLVLSDFEQPENGAAWTASREKGGGPGLENMGGGSVDPGTGLTYEVWKAEHFEGDALADEAISGRLADPDRDGRANIWEYVSGSMPHVADQQEVFRVFSDEDGDAVRLSWRRRDGVEDIDMSFESSSDLQQWEAMEIQGITVEAGGPAPIHSAAIPRGDQARYLRAVLTWDQP